MSELKNCPFCGGEADIEEIPGSPFTDESYTWGVGCKTCNIGWYEETKERTIAVWNRRADGWISVDDRLPKRNDHILTYTPSKNCYAEATEVSRGFMLGLKNSIVTHWMLLPQPPGGDRP